MIGRNERLSRAQNDIFNDLGLKGKPWRIRWIEVIEIRLLNLKQASVQVKIVCA